MAQERERQVFLLPDSTNASSRSMLGLSDGVDAQVRQLGVHEVALESLDRVEVGRVGGVSLHDQPGPLRGEESVHPAAKVTG